MLSALPNYPRTTPSTRERRRVERRRVERDARMTTKLVMEGHHSQLFILEDLPL